MPSLISKDVTNETVLITGGAGGIGSLMAKQFAKLGVKNIVLVDINVEALDVAKQEIENVVEECDGKQMFFASKRTCPRKRRPPRS